MCDQAKDSCRPGFICLEELGNRPDCGAHCYRLCRNDQMKCRETLSKIN